MIYDKQQNHVIKQTRTAVRGYTKNTLFTALLKYPRIAVEREREKTASH